MTESSKRRRVDASDWEGETLSAASEALKPEIKGAPMLLDKVALEIQREIMSMLTVSDNTEAFQQGFYMVPVTLKHRAMLAAKSINIDVTTRERIGKKLIAHWARSGFGQMAQELRMTDGEVAKDGATIVPLLLLFPKLTSIQAKLGQVDMDAVCAVLAPLQLRSVRISLGTKTVLLSRYPFSYTFQLSMGMPSTRIGFFQSQYKTLHVLHWPEQIPEALVTSVARALPPVLEDLLLSLEKMPDDFWDILIKQCPRLVKLALSWSGSEETRQLPVLTSKGVRRWTDLEVHQFDVSPEALASLASPDLVRLLVGPAAIDVDEKATRHLLDTCSALQHLHVKFTDGAAFRKVLFASRAAATLRTSGMFVQLGMSESELIEDAKAVPRMRRLQFTMYGAAPPPLSSAWARLLADSAHRDAVAFLDIDKMNKTYAQPDWCNMTAEEWAQLITNSDAWTTLTVPRPAKNQPMPARVVDWLAARCGNLRHLTINATVDQPMESKTIHRLMTVMTHGTLVFGSEENGGINAEDMPENKHLRLSVFDPVLQRASHDLPGNYRLSHRIDADKGDYLLLNEVLTGVTAQDILEFDHKMPFGCRFRCAFVVPRETLLPVIEIKDGRMVHHLGYTGFAPYDGAFSSKYGASTKYGTMGGEWTNKLFVVIVGRS